MKIVWGRSIGFNIELNKMVQATQPIPNGRPVEYTIIENGAGCYPWTKTFVMLPRKSINGQPLFWQKAYKRRVWVVWGTGFHMEPEIQYATLFEILKDEQ